MMVIYPNILLSLLIGIHSLLPVPLNLQPSLIWYVQRRFFYFGDDALPKNHAANFPGDYFRCLFCYTMLFLWFLLRISVPTPKATNWIGFISHDSLSSKQFFGCFFLKKKIAEFPLVIVFLATSGSLISKFPIEFANFTFYLPLHFSFFTHQL